MQANEMTKKPKKNHKHLDNALVYAGLIVASLLVVLPFAIVFMTSFMTAEDATTGGFSLIGKSGMTFQGYKEFFNYKDYYTGVPRFLTGLVSTMRSRRPQCGSRCRGWHPRRSPLRRSVSA